MLKKIRLGVTLFVILGIVAGIGNALGMTGHSISLLEKIGFIIMSVVFGALLFVIIYYWWGKDYKCQACNKRFC